MPFFSFLLAFFLLALAQPDLSLFACIFASGMGYALLWRTMLFLSSPVKRFLFASLFFAAIQAIHLSWFTSDRYVGAPIFVFLIFLWASLGMLFGLVSLLIPKEAKEWNLTRILGIAAIATLLEWARLFFLVGYTWNPIGLPLSATTAGLQFVSLMGVFGLTFWVLFTNLLFLRWLVNRAQKPLFFVWLLAFLLPFGFGIAHLQYHQKQMSKHPDSLAVVLVQTALAPEEKIHFPGYSETVFSPVEQWQRILSLLSPHVGKKIDLIVFPEAVVPYGTDFPVYPISTVSKAFSDLFNSSFLLHEKGDAHVGNSYWARCLANYFHSDVVIGLEEYSQEGAYNAAFHFTPDSGDYTRYEKRILVPLGEYIPFQWCKRFLQKYGIVDSYKAGEKATIFAGSKVPMGISICYEETFGHLMRENKLEGAELLVNLTNDVWYPHSRLPKVHFFHGKLRSVEMGVPIVRACNTGVTCAVDSLGHVVGSLPADDKRTVCPADALYVHLPTYTYKTLYACTGNALIIALSGFFAFIFLTRRILG